MIDYLKYLFYFKFILGYINNILKLQCVEIDVIRFYNEYTFLELRLKFLKKEFSGIYEEFQTEAYIATTSNSGKKNKVNLKILEELKKSYNFNFVLYEIPKQYLNSCSRSAEDYCFDFINNSIKDRDFRDDN